MQWSNTVSAKFFLKYQGFQGFSHCFSRFFPQFLAYFLGPREKCMLLSNSNWYVSRISFEYQKSHFVVFHSSMVQRYISLFRVIKVSAKKLIIFQGFPGPLFCFQGFQSFQGFQGCRQPAKRDDQSPESILVLKFILHYSTLWNHSTGNLVITTWFNMLSKKYEYLRGWFDFVPFSKNIDKNKFLR